MKVHSFRSHRSWNNSGIKFWFLVAVSNNEDVVFSTTRTNEVKLELEEYAKKFFQNHKFSFIISKTGYEIYGKCLAK